MRSERSNTVTRWPARLSCCAAARPAGPEPTTATRRPGAMRRRLGADPAFVERPIDDGLFDLLDRDRVIVDGEHACRLAWRGAQTAGELREVVGGVEPLHGSFPVIAGDEVVPLGDEVAERTSVVAEGDAAVHAPRSLVAQHLHRQRQVHLAVVGDPFRNRPLVGGVPRVLEEPGARRHQLTNSSWARSARRYSSGITFTKCSRS